MDNINEKFNKSKEIIYYLKKKTKLMKYIRPKQLYYSINIDNNNSNINLLNYFEYNNDTNIECSNVKIIIKSNKNIYYNNNIYLNSNLNTVLYNEIFIINEQFKKEKFNYNIDISIIENEYYDYYKIDNNTYYKSDIFRLNINEEPLKKISIKNDNLIFNNIENESGIKRIINNIKNYIEYNENLDLIIEIENSSIEKSNLSLIKIKENCNITLKNNNSNFNIFNYLDLRLVDKDFDFKYIIHSDYYRIESNNIIFNKSYTSFNYDITLEIINKYSNLKYLNLNVTDRRFNLIYNNLNTFIISDNNNNLNIYNYLNFNTFRFSKDQIFFSNIEKKNYYDITYNSNINFKKYYYEYEINFDLLLFDEIKNLNLNIKDERYLFALESLNLEFNITNNNIIDIYNKLEFNNLGLNRDLISFSNITLNPDYYEIIGNSNIIFNNYLYNHNITLDIIIDNNYNIDLYITDKRYDLININYNSNINITTGNNIINLFNIFSNLNIEYNIPYYLISFSNVLPKVENYELNNSNLIFKNYYQYNYNINLNIYIENIYYNIDLYIIDKRYNLININYNSNIIITDGNNIINLLNKFSNLNIEYNIPNYLISFSNILPNSDLTFYYFLDLYDKNKLIFVNYYQYSYNINLEIYIGNIYYNKFYFEVVDYRTSGNYGAAY